MKTRISYKRILAGTLLLNFSTGAVHGQIGNYQTFNASGANSWNTAVWSGSGVSPNCTTGTSAFTAGSNAYFCTPNGTGAGTIGINIGGITATESYTHTTGAGTLGTNSTVATINIATGKQFDLGTGPLTATSSGTGFNKTGGGAFAFAGSAYGGGFTLTNGTIVLRGVNTMGTGALVLNGGVVAADADRNLTGKYTSITIGGNVQFGEVSTNVPLASGSSNLTFSNAMTLGSAIRTLTLGGSGTITFGGAISGTGGINFTANSNGTGGRFVLSGASTYSGATTIAGGTVDVNGSLASGSAVTVSSGGVLGGTGTINGTVSVDGTITAGTVTTAGTLTTGDLTMEAGGRYVVTLNKVPAAGLAGTDWDKIATTGMSNNATGASPFTVALNGTIANFDSSVTYTWQIGSYSGPAPSSTNITVSTSGLSTNTSSGTFSVSFGSGQMRLTYTPTPCVAAIAPTALTFTGTSSTSVPLSFTAPGTAPSGYTIFRSTVSTPPTLTNGVVYSGSNAPLNYTFLTNQASLSYTDNSVSSGTTYYYHVFGYNNTSCSGGPKYSSALKAVVTPGTTGKWRGTVSTSWTLATNWENGTVPNDSTDVVVPTGLTNNPAIISGNVSIRNLFIATGASLNVSGTGALTLNGVATVNGTLSTNNALTLNNGASLGPIAGAVVGLQMTIKRNIPGGRRTNRFLSHPFNTSQALTQLTDDFDITGTGGSANGFTTTQTNNPSSFYYDNTIGPTNTVNDPCWQAFTSTSATTWRRGKGIRALVRGAKGEGLNGLPYTPSATELDMTGTINAGSFTDTLTKSLSPYNMVGNPYPAPVNIDALLASAGSGVASTYYVWDPQGGAIKGAYATRTVGAGAYYLPVFGVALVKCITNNTVLNFTESLKGDAATQSLLRTTGATKELVELKLTSDSFNFDNFFAVLDANAATGFDDGDGGKIINPEASFYAQVDTNKLAVDARPFADNTTVRMSLQGAAPRTYKLSVASNTLQPGHELFLHDRYLGTFTKLDMGAVYSFAVTADSLSSGDNRFEITHHLNLEASPDEPSAVAAAVGGQQFSVFPNPTTGALEVGWDAARGEASLQVTDLVGRVLHQRTGTSGSATLDLRSLPAGVYLINLEAGGVKACQRFVKQ
jgi:autotransporter-associated beta strand protein